MVKESEARVTAVVVLVAVTIMGALAWRVTTEKEDNITGEVPVKAMSITLRFAGLL